MRLVFMGTPASVVPVLEALLQAGHQVVGVYTQPDRPAGRGRVPDASPVKQFASSQGLPVFQPPSLRRPEAVEGLRSLAPEAIVVAAYGKLLPPEVLTLAPLGCLNVHPSLLPNYRGPSPIVSAILEGEEETGVTIILLDEGMDTGPILAHVREQVRPEDTAESLTQRLFQLAARLLVETLERWAREEMEPVPQGDAGASVTRMVEKEDGRLSFEEPAALLGRRVRAYQPWPGAYTTWKGRLLKILDAIPIATYPSGAVGLVVALEARLGAPAGIVTRDGVLGLRRLQLEGRRPVTCEEFLQGHRDFAGSRLSS